MKIVHTPKEAKKQQLERLLQNGTVMVMLDARKPGVQVPAEHQGNPQLALNFDYMYNIHDFKILDDRIEASLEFHSLNFFCIIPFDAVYGYRPHSGDEVIVFPESVPQDIAPPQQAKPEQTVPEKPFPPLSVVEPRKEQEPAGNEPESKKKKGGHLKLVK